MSIAALMVDLDDLPSYTQESDVEYDQALSEAAMTMESDDRALNTLDHAMSSLADIQMTFESDGELSTEANKYLGLALDAAIGKPQTLFVGGMSFKTHDSSLSLEADATDKKEGMWAKFKAMVVAAYNRVASFFSNAGSFIMGFLSKKRRLDKALSEAEAALSGYTETKEEFVISKGINASLGGKGVTDVKGINGLIENFNKSTASVVDKAETAIKYVMDIIAHGPTDTFGDVAVKYTASIIELSNDLDKAKEGFPGNQSAMMTAFSDTTLGGILAKIPGVGKYLNARIYVSTVGERPDEEIKLSGSPSVGELKALIASLKALDKQLESLSKVTKSKQWMEIAKVKGADGDFKIPDTTDAGLIAKMKLNNQIKAYAVSNPTIRLAGNMVKESSRIYAAGVQLVVQAVKAGKLKSV